MRYYKVYSKAVTVPAHVIEITGIESMSYISNLIDDCLEESTIYDIRDMVGFISAYEKAQDYGLDNASHILQSGRPVECGDFAIYATTNEADAPEAENKYSYTDLLEGFIIYMEKTML